MEYVEIELGGAVRRLALDANAMIAMAELTGTDITQEFVELAKPSAAATEGKPASYTGRLKTMRNLVWALSASACPEFVLDPGRTVQQVGAWFGLRDIPKIAEALAKLMGELEMPKEFPEQMAPFVPSPMPVVEAMVRLAEIKPNELLVDLGAGDGRLMLRALDAGAQAVGYELHAERYIALQQRLNSHRGRGLVGLYHEDLRTASVKQADAVTLYLLPASNAELKAKLLAECKPGARIISHDFAMPEWEPDTVEQVQCEDRIHTVYRWIVPERPGAGSD